MVRGFVQRLNGYAVALGAKIFVVGDPDAGKVHLIGLLQCMVSWYFCDYACFRSAATKKITRIMLMIVGFALLIAGSFWIVYTFARAFNT